MQLRPGILAELLEHRELNALDHGIYLLTYATGPASLNELAARAHVSWSAAARSCVRLANAGWLALDAGRVRRKRPRAIVPAAAQNRAAAVLEDDYSMAANRGEFLMKSLLDAWIYATRMVDNARPPFLKNPSSNQPLEYDRYYPVERVAFEFNGPQHLTAQQSAEDQVSRDLRTRDLVKTGLSLQAGVELVVLAAEDLRPERFVRILPSALRRRPVDTDGPYLRSLIRICNAYADKASRGT